MAKFLNLNGLTTLLNQLKQNFASKDEMNNLEVDNDTYILNIDYENTLAFDTSWIVGSSSSTSPLLDVGLLDSMILA